MPKRSRPMEKLTPRTALTFPWGPEIHMQVFDIKDLILGIVISAPYLFARGSRTSRSPSPKKLNARLTTKIARPGNVETHHCSNKYWRPSDTMAPHSGDGGCAPKPRNQVRRRSE